MTDSQASSKYAPIPGKIPGISVSLGGHVFVIAPLNLDQIQQFEDLVPKLGAGGLNGLRETMPLIVAAIQRNYPDFTETDARALIDMGNLKQVAEAIVGVNELSRASGETAPASP